MPPQSGPPPTSDGAPPPPPAAPLPKAYDPAAVEARIYALWEERGCFRPSGAGAPFTIIMPPPNLTGELHVGSALTYTLQDVLIRWHRMLGYDTLWQPGVDHAAIAVNALVERALAKEGLTRHDIGREQFLERVWIFVNRSRDYISQQFRRLGASADWEREVFTMDPGPRRAVRTTFKRLYDDGLIYRSERIINWCPDCGTSLSDLEVEHADEPGFWWHVRYPILDAQWRPSNDSLIVATTRPETIPADTALAVHPDDPRYRHLIGGTVLVPTSDRAVPVIADEAVSMEAGSGVLKVTPGHDPVDFEIGQRHGLPTINLIAPDGTLTAEAGAYAGLDRFAARDRVVADLEAKGLVERIEPYTHPIGHCERSGTIVEPLISLQWYVRMAPLAEPAIAAVRDGRIRFVPARFERTYMHWMENIRDWCISRQIWWGHRIPVWYCDDCPEITVAVEDPAACAHCDSPNIHQDEDTLDTWFSSGLWPHSTLGWPDDTDALRRYYPTQVMQTGYDIIFFWVARMIMLSLYNTGAAPFEVVYLNGLVRAADGQKMSKSRGNVVDFMETTTRYGADALRFSLATGSTPGNDMRLTNERLEGGRNFANKLWNGARFALTELAAEAVAPPDPAARDALALEDRWILSRLHRLGTTVDTLLSDLQLSEAGRQIHDFLWSELFDWYLEASKPRLRSGDRSPLPVLAHTLDTGLRLLHPYMPFVTEEIWQRLRPLLRGEEAPALIVAAYPRGDARWHDPDAERDFALIQDVVRAIRATRAERGVEAGRWVEAYVVTPRAALLQERRSLVEALARARPLHVTAERAEAPSEQVVVAVLDRAEVILPLGGLVDLAAERERLHREIAEAQAYHQRVLAKLGDERFRTRAPAPVVEREAARRDEIAARLAGLRARLAELS